MTEEKEKKKTGEPKESKLESALRVEVDWTGKEGKYFFDIQVISNFDRGYKCRVKIVEGHGFSKTEETDKDGFIDYYKAQEFTKKRRTFKFRIIGSAANAEITLPGPKPGKIDRIPGGALANFKHVLEENRKNK